MWQAQRFAGCPPRAGDGWRDPDAGRGRRSPTRLSAAAPERAIAIDQCPMVAMQLTGPDLSQPQLAGGPAAHYGSLPAAEPIAGAGQFQPLEAGIISDAIPAFSIGQNRDGFWVVRDAKGRTGGIFLFQGSALAFAKRKSRPAGCATIFPSERFELDIKNRGNPLVVQLGWLVQLAIRTRGRMAAAIGKFSQAVNDRLQDFRRF
jgi:hypothetical protein